MKIFARLLTICLVASFIVSCAGTPAATQPPVVQPPVSNPATGVPPTAVPPTEVPLSAAEQWAKDNGLGAYQPATEDWAAVEAAAKLEGKSLSIPILPASRM